MEGWKIKDVPLEEARELEPQAAEVFAQIVIKALRDSMTPENQGLLLFVVVCCLLLLFVVVVCCCLL